MLLNIQQLIWYRISLDAETDHFPFDLTKTHRKS